MGEHQKDIENGRIEKVLSINWDKVSILDIESNSNKRKISKMLNIHLQKRPINKKEDLNKLHDSYISILNKLKIMYK